MTEQRTFVTTDEAFRNDQAISWIFLCGGGSLAYFVWLTPHWWSDLVYMVLLGLAGLVALSCGYTLWSSKQNDYFYSVTVDALGLQFLDHERRLTSLPWSHIAGVQEASVRKGIELQELSGKTRYLPATLEHFTELVALIAAQTSSFQPPVSLPTTFMVDFRVPLAVLFLIGVLISVLEHEVSLAVLLAGLGPSVIDFLLSLRRPWRLEVTQTGLRLFRGIRISAIAYRDIQSLFMSSQTVLGLGVAIKLSDGQTRLVSLSHHNPFLIYYAVQSGWEQSGRIQALSRQNAGVGTV